LEGCIWKEVLSGLKGSINSLSDKGMIYNGVEPSSGVWLAVRTFLPLKRWEYRQYATNSGNSGRRCPWMDEDGAERKWDHNGTFTETLRCAHVRRRATAYDVRTSLGRYADRPVNHEMSQQTGNLLSRRVWVSTAHELLPINVSVGTTTRQHNH